MKIARRYLKVGDRIQLFEGAYSTGTITEIKNDMAIVIRPYVYLYADEFGHYALRHETVSFFVDNDIEEIVLDRAQ